MALVRNIDVQPESPHTHAAVVPVWESALYFRWFQSPEFSFCIFDQPRKRNVPDVSRETHVGVPMVPPQPCGHPPADCTSVQPMADQGLKPRFTARPFVSRSVLVSIDLIRDFSASRANFA